MQRLLALVRQRQKLILVSAQIVFWIAKTVSLYHQHTINPERTFFWNMFDTGTMIAWQIAAVYTCTGFLFRRLYLKGKYGAYWVFVIAVILASPMMDLLTQAVAIHILRPGHLSESLFIIYIAHLIDCVVVVAIFIIVLMGIYYYRKDQQNKLREKDRIESELMFLKSQVNPHFLFNALNSIYVLMKEDVGQSEKTLLQFASLLRYQLYDCSNALTLLNDEIEFVRNYIGIESLRTGDHIKITTSLPDECGSIKIAPFIIIPFVENAFKHVSRSSGMQNIVTLEMQIVGDCLEMLIENTFDPHAPEVSAAKGIGLANARRRLQLLYNNKHHLNISATDNKYTVLLKIELDDD